MNVFNCLVPTVFLGVFHAMVSVQQIVLVLLALRHRLPAVSGICLFYCSAPVPWCRTFPLDQPHGIAGLKPEIQTRYYRQMIEL